METLRLPNERGANTADTKHDAPGCSVRGCPAGKQLVPTAKSYASPLWNVMLLSVTGLPVRLRTIADFLV
jgi:hypothetical protein